MYYWYRAKCQHNTFSLHYIARYQLFECYKPRNNRLHEVLFLRSIFILIDSLPFITNTVYYYLVQEYSIYNFTYTTFNRISMKQKYNLSSSFSFLYPFFTSVLFQLHVFPPFPFMSLTCRVSNVKLSQPPVDIKFFPPLPTIFFFPSTHILSVQPLFMIWVEISHLLFLNEYTDSNSHAFNDTRTLLYKH